MRTTWLGHSNLSMWLLYVCFVLLVACGSGPDILGPRHPNILLINVDDLGWKDLGFMGSAYYETPNLDVLASQGMVFTQAYSGAANCAPSRACLLTGLNTPRHGVYTVGNSDRGNAKTRRLVPVVNTQHLEDTVYTLPRMLQSVGYVTGSFGKWHVGNDPTRQGIDHNVGGSHRGSPGRDGYFAPYNIDFIEDGPEGEYLTDRLTSEAIAFMEANKDSTFFAYVPFYTVHTPIMGKEEWVGKYELKEGVDGQDNPVYGAMVSAMDENVGRLLHALDRMGLADNTLVIFTADNGGIRDISYQTPLRAGKGSYYEGGIRVPLVIRWPGNVPAGVTNTNRVSNLDFYPTIQEIIQPPKRADRLDGMSLVPQLQEPVPTRRDLFFHFPIYLQAYSTVEDDGRDALFRTRPGSVVISGDWKLHQFFEDGGLELYDLANDPGERTNLAEERPEVAQAMLTKLEEWRETTGAPIPTERSEAFDAAFERAEIEAAKPGK